MRKKSKKRNGEKQETVDRGFFENLISILSENFKFKFGFKFAFKFF